MLSGLKSTHSHRPRAWFQKTLHLARDLDPGRSWSACPQRTPPTQNPPNQHPSPQATMLCVSAQHSMPHCQALMCLPHWSLTSHHPLLLGCRICVTAGGGRHSTRLVAYFQGAVGKPSPVYSPTGEEGWVLELPRICTVASQIMIRDEG